MLNEKYGYNIATDIIRSKSTKNGYIKVEASSLKNKNSVTANTLTLSNQYDMYDWTNTSTALTLSIPNGLINSSYARSIILCIYSHTSDRTLTVNLGSDYKNVNGTTTFTISSGKPAIFKILFLGTNVLISKDGGGSSSLDPSSITDYTNTEF